MAFPTTFANLGAGTQPLALLDNMFNVVAGMGTIYCASSGTNTLALTPITNMPTVSSYASYQVFGFYAGSTTSGSVTLNVSGVGAKNAYDPSGLVQLGSGSILGGFYYLFSYNPALAGGAGGFQLVTNPQALTPTVQTFTSGTGTYTTPVLARWIDVTVVGAGGGSGGNGTAGGSAGGGGGTSSFGSWTAVGGNGSGVVVGFAGSSGPNGGTGGANGPGTQVLRQNGIQGQAGDIGSSALGARGGDGGGSVLFGPNHVVTSASNAGFAGKLPGQGAAGAGGNGGPGYSATAGGGGGEFVNFIVASPAATYSYAIGAGGTAGTAGTSGLAGALGSSGIIIVKEFYA